MKLSIYFFQSLVIISLAVMFSGCASTTASPKGPATTRAEARLPANLITPATAQAIQFGIFKSIEPGHYSNEGFEEATTVALTPGVNYGWRFKTVDGHGPYRWHEEFMLPKSADWQVPNNVNAESPQVPAYPYQHTVRGKTAITNGISQAEERWIGHAWGVLESDPAGEYILVVKIEDVGTKTFHVQFKRPSTR